MKLDFFVHATQVEIRKDKDISVVRGLAVPYSQWSKPIYGMFKEQFRRGCIRQLKDTNDDEVFAYVEHESSMPLARRSNGGLKLIDTPEGCWAEVPLNNTSYALDLAENIRTGVVKGMSFGFRQYDETWREDEKMPERTITDCDIREVTFTHNPAYPQTTAQMRSGYSVDESLQIAKTKLIVMKLPEIAEPKPLTDIINHMRIRGV